MVRNVTSIMILYSVLLVGRWVQESY